MRKIFLQYNYTADRDIIAIEVSKCGPHMALWKKTRMDSLSVMGLCGPRTLSSCVNTEGMRKCDGVL